jgi:hypothetical protein
MQVVTPDTMVDFIKNGSVPEFKPPTAETTAKPDAATTTTTEAKADAKVEVKETPPRDESGKFTKPETAEVKADEKPAETKTEADDDVKLTQKIEKLINKKHRAMKEAEEFGASEARKAIAAEQRAADLQRQIDELKGTKSDGAKPDGDEPKPEDFKTVGEYTRALVKYEAKRAGEIGQKQAVQSQQQAHAQEIISQFVQRQDAFKAATPDYETVVGESELEVPNIAQQYLVESEMGPQLAYHLAKNPDEVTRLQKLSPSRVLAELGKLEVKLEAKPVATATTVASSVSKAPAPIQPLEAKSTPVTKDPSQMSFQELRQYRLAGGKG